VAVVEVERNADGPEARVAVVWLNRPQARNALSAAMVDGLERTLVGLEDDPSVGAIVLAGRGKAFCAGGDLKEGLAAGDGFVAAHEGRGRYADLLRAFATSRLPIVAAVEGDAMGGGMGLAAAADVVVAGNDARFGTPELRLGLFPWIIAVVLQRDVPRKRLSELVLTGGRWTAEEAHAAGLVSRVVSAGAAVDEAVAIGARMAAFSPAVVGAGKAALHHVADLGFDAGLAHMHAQLSLNLLTDDATEGIAAFLERRDPTWRGR
jgi:enoyl-CoA hydratase/carnithine racemase